MNILITGGAGYIGSHIVKQLGESTSYNITTIDNLSTGFKKSVLYGDFIKCDLNELNIIEDIFRSKKFDVVIHCAASIEVPESIKNPLKYYLNNTCNTTNLINMSIKYGIKKFIFSSTAAVYGNASVVPVKESGKIEPINPYGWSKAMSERVLIETANRVNGFDFVILRYFNVAGASVDNRIGQSYQNATHLIKVASEAAIGKRDCVYIFGDSYNTHDGTCIRDFIHIEDLAMAHIKAIEYKKSDIFNCGYSTGYSVKEVIDAVKNISGVRFKTRIVERRDGDVENLVADNTKILKEMGWRPRYNNLNFICETSLKWERKINETNNTNTLL
jgi:UDP-glucose 4-epimerase